MKRTRTRYSSEEKVSIVRRHLIDGVLVSDLCDEFGIQPTVFSGGRSSYLIMYPRHLRQKIDGEIGL